MSSLLTHYPILIIVIITVFLIGHLLITPFSKRDYAVSEYIFYRLLAGIIGIPTAVAMLYTKGGTVLFGVLLVGLMIIPWRIKWQFDYKPKKLKEWGALHWVLLLGVALWMLFETSYPLLLRQDAVHIDYIYYGRAAQQIMQTGVESFFEVPELALSGGLNPYHYIDLWLIATGIKCLPFDPYTIAMCYVYPLCLVTMFLGLVAICERQLINGRLRIFILLLPLVAVFCSAIRFTADSSSAWMSYTALHFYKNSIIGIFLLFAFLRLRYKLSESVAGMVLLGICFSTMLPPVFMGVSIWLGLLFLVHAQKKELLKPAGIIAIGTAWFVMHYYFLHQANPADMSDSKSVVEFDFVSFSTGVLSKFFKLLRTHVLYILILVVIVMTQGVKLLKAKSWLLGGALIVASVITYGVFQASILDSYQFMGSIVSILTVLLVLKMGLLLIQIVDSFYIKIAGLGLLFGLNFLSHPTNSVVAVYKSLRGSSEVYQNYYHTISADSRSFLKNTLQGNHRPKFVLLDNVSEYESVFETNFMLNQPLPSLLYECPNYSMAFLSVFELVTHKKFQDNKYTQSRVKSSVFYQFVEQQKAEGSFVSIEESQLAFVNEYDIDYIVMHKKCALPASLTSKVVQQVPIPDKEFLLLSIRK